MSLGSYRESYRRSLDEPTSFWEEAAQGIDWIEPWQEVCDHSQPPFTKWFAGAMMNTCYNAVDRHVEAGRGEQAALIYDSPITSQKKTLTYAMLQEQVSRCAGMLRELGVEKGDRVVIYMPMILETAISMLACARLGAIHSVVFGGFAAPELAVRVDDAKPKVIVCGSCGIEPSRVIAYKPMLEEALGLASHQPAKVVVVQREQLPADLVEGRDVEWTQGMAAAPAADCVPVRATDPLYILYTSGTTGVPKGIVRDNGGHAVALKWSMEHIYDVRPGEAFWAASDFGWVVGHSYIVYAPLLHGCTSIVFEGKPVGTPDAGVFWRVISEHKVVSMFTAPTAMRAIRKVDPEGERLKEYDLSCLRAQFLAGERCDPSTFVWVQQKLQVPVVDHWWQTETGWAITANPLGLEKLRQKPGSAAVPMPGWDLRVLGPDKKELPPGEVGALVVKLPMPPSALPTLWQNDERFVSSYMEGYPGYYQTGDAGLIDEDGFVHVMSRTDDIINVAGHRLSTGGMEQVLAAHPAVAECAVIGVADALKGQVPLGLVVCKPSVEIDPAFLQQELIQSVRQEIGPVASFKLVVEVKRLPKTRSGKILRGTMRKIADGTEWKMPATIDDPAILNEIKKSLQALGFPKG